MTKYIICLGDGMADEPLPSLEGKTPLQAAKIPNMDSLAKAGCVGEVKTVPEGLSPGSDVANMGILGYDPREFYTGRGPIEAASLKVRAAENQVIFRCNLVTIQGSVMKDFTANHISSEESAVLLEELNNHFQNETTSFVPGVSYRNLLLLDKKFLELQCCAPHDITDQEIGPFLPSGPFENELASFLEACHNILKQSAVNKKRIKKGLLPATHIWPWSQGAMPKLPSFKTRFGKTGGIITAVDLLKGLGQLTGLETPSVKGATGFLDTNYSEKIKESLKILETHDFVYIHVEAPDEAGHMGDETLKIKAIEDFDRNIIGPIKTYIANNKDCVLLILPDHPTPCSIKTHTSNPVPFILYFSGIQGNKETHYSEKEGQNSHLKYHAPWELLTDMFTKKPLC